MITGDFGGRAVLVTGGTRGIGKAIAEEFARAKATVYVTHRWGSVDEAELAAEFVAAGLTPPVIVEADASDPEATRDLMRRIKADVGRLHAVVSNVSFAKIVNDTSDLKKSSLDLSLGFSAWPVVDMVQATHEVFGSYPPYVLAISGDGGDVCMEGYDLVGASKAVLETLCRYLAVRLKPRGTRVNIIRAGYVDTPSARATFTEEGMERAHRRLGSLFMDPSGVGRTCVALCTGMLDSVTGQVLVVDEGWSLISPLTYVTGRSEVFEFPEKSEIS